MKQWISISSPHAARKFLILGLVVVGGLFWGSQAISETSPPVQEATPPVGIHLKNLALPPGLDTLTGIVNTTVERKLEIQALDGDTPIQGRKIKFMLMSVPAKSKGFKLLKTEAITDKDGKAFTELSLGSKKGNYVVAAFFEDRLDVVPARFTVAARDGGWVAFLIFGLLGGLGIFLMGMEMSGDGLKEAAGERMRGILSALTSNRVFGLLIGIVATAILQSSSATTVMLVGFVSATMMNLTQAIGVMIGAKIGTTVTAQLIAFNLSEYSLLLVAVGFLMRVVSKKKSLKQGGNIILGFGLIFFGLGVMGGAMRPLRTVPEFSELLVSLGKQPLLGILVAVAFTGIVQSSAATIGLAIALCASGLLSLEAGLPLAWGAHVGTCATALLSSLGTGREGKQVAVSHLIFSVLGVAVAFPFLGYFVDGARVVTAWMGSESVARELVNGHMLFTIATGIVLLPFIKQVEWLTVKIVPPLKTAPPFGPKYLAKTSLDVPVLALEQALMEIMRLAGIVRGMMLSSMESLVTPSEESAETIGLEDDKVDILEKAIRPFLAQVAQRGLDPKLSAREHGFIYIVQDFEGIGDVINKEIASVGRKLFEKDLLFSEEGLSELQQYHGKLLKKFDRIVEAVRIQDRSKAEETIQLGFKERIMERKFRQAHLGRLHSGKKCSVETSSMHLSVLNNLRAIGERLDDIARTILEEM
jgi:phosphate:Na+ symporter